MGCHYDRSSNWILWNEKYTDQMSGHYLKCDWTDVVDQISLAYTNHSRQRKGIHERIHLYDKKVYSIKPKAITSRNPQANSIIERVHQTLGNILHTFHMHDAILDKDNPWDRIIAAIIFAIKATIHIITQKYPL